MNELNMGAVSHVKMRGEYSIEVRDSRTKERVANKCRKVSNTITNYMRDLVATGSVTFNTTYNSDDPLMDTIVYGRFATGTGIISATHTNLDGTVSNYVSSNNNIVADFSRLATVDNLDGTHTFGDERIMIFAPGTLTGTWGQVGLFSNSGTTTLLAGQQLKDDIGNATTLTISETEEVTLRYRLYITFKQDIDPLLKPENANTDLTIYPVLNTTSQIINGQVTDVIIRSWTSFVSPEMFADYNYPVGTPSKINDYYNYLDNIAALIDDGTGTFIKDAIDINQAPYGAPNLPATIIETITYGSVYKYTQEFTVPYQAWENKIIKGLVGHSGYFDTLWEHHNCLGVIEFSPPIPKGVGNEIRIKFSLTYTFS